MIKGAPLINEYEFKAQKWRICPAARTPRVPLSPKRETRALFSEFSEKNAKGGLKI